MKQVLVVYKKSTFELYSNSDDGAVKAAAIGDSENAKRLQEGHEVQQRSLERIASELESHGVSHEMIYRADLERINDRQVVLSVGGDGTVLEVSHYVSQAQVMGINSDPSKSR